MQAFAPGKLVVLGEYAVLDGCPALALAVNNGVKVTVSTAPRRVLVTPDGDDRFVRAALDAIEGPAGRYVFETAHPLDLPGKPGLGGSAAAVVCALLAGGCAPEALLSTGLAVHHAVQGSGSGIDVAVSATGGGIRFEAGAVTPVAMPTPVVVYAGESAKTGPRVLTYRAWSDRRAFVDASKALVEAFPDEPVRATRAAWRLLVTMSEQAGLLYTTPAIDRIVALAEQHGGAAKPSGAGGGDVVIAWVDDRAALQAALRAEGFAVLDVETGDLPWVSTA